MKILVFSADPFDEWTSDPTNPVNLGAEMRGITDVVSWPKRLGHVDLELVPQARKVDVDRYVSASRPAVVHWCGHGKGKDAAVVVDPTLDEKLENVEPSWLATSLRARGVRLLILNCGQSRELAENAMVLEAVGCAIGTAGTVEGEIAPEFAGRIYKRLLTGSSIREAFDSVTKADPQFAEYELFSRTESLENESLLSFDDTATPDEGSVNARLARANERIGAAIKTRKVESWWDFGKLAFALAAAVVTWFLFGYHREYGTLTNGLANENSPFWLFGLLCSVVITVPLLGFWVKSKWQDTSVWLLVFTALVVAGAANACVWILHQGTVVAPDQSSAIAFLLQEGSADIAGLLRQGKYLIYLTVLTTATGAMTMVALQQRPLEVVHRNTGIGAATLSTVAIVAVVVIWWAVQIGLDDTQLESIRSKWQPLAVYLGLAAAPLGRLVRFFIIRGVLGWEEATAHNVSILGSDIRAIEVQSLETAADALAGTEISDDE